MEWPKTADGDVFRRLQADGFDFSAHCVIDFNVDFEAWPPAEQAVRWLKASYGDVAAYTPTKDFSGYIQFKVRTSLTFDLVIHVQEHVSAAMGSFGGHCESWGVLHG